MAFVYVSTAGDAEWDPIDVDDPRTVWNDPLQKNRPATPPMPKPEPAAIVIESDSEDEVTPYQRPESPTQAWPCAQGSPKLALVPKGDPFTLAPHQIEPTTPTASQFNF